MADGNLQPTPIDTASSPPRTLLDYTQLRPARTRRDQWRTIVKVAGATVVVAGVFSVGVYSGKIVREHAPDLFGPGAAIASYDLAPGTIVYEELPGAAKTLLADTAYINPLGHRQPVAIHSNRQTRDAYRMLTRAKTVDSAADHGAQALLAQLETADGRSRIISVRYLPAGVGATGNGVQMAGFLIETFDLTGFLPQPKRVYQAFVADLVGAFPTDGRRDFRLFAGEIESDEAGHFTIPYEAGTRRGIIDGYLRPDGRTVDIELRDDAIHRMLEINPVHTQVDRHIADG